MPLLNWSNDLKVNIKSIDEDHKKLVDLINQLHDEMSGNDLNRGLIESLLEQLLDDSYNHFINEENLFNQTAYPDAANHLAEHDAFSSVIMELLQKYEAGQSVSLETLDFLQEWLDHHLKIVDQNYGDFLRRQGVA